MKLLMTVQQLFNLTDFVTGLVFFVMGFIILLQYKQYKHLSDLKIVKKIWILALFGLFHGFGQWVAAITPISLTPHVPPNLSFWFNMWQLLLNTVSYCCLYWFAVEVMSLFIKKDIFFRFTIWFFSLLWLLIFLLTYSVNWITWINTGLTWSRFLLAFPGSILAALAFNLEAREFRTVGMPNIVNNLYGAIVSFCLYGLSCGLNPPNAPLLTLFSGYWHAALSDILRTVGGLGMAAFIIRVMEIFNIENNKKLAAARYREATLQERLRIGRDLHDGIIQSLYAIGLRLEVVGNTMDTSPAKSKQILNSVMGDLDGVIHEIRHYILALTVPEGQDTKWQESIQELAESYAGTGLEVKLSYEAVDELELDLHYSQKLLYVIREAISNAVRHGQASEVLINICQKKEQLHIDIKDNGKGFDVKTLSDELRFTGHGIKNMENRIASLGGEFSITGRPGQGTEVHIVLPLKLFKVNEGG